MTTTTAAAISALLVATLAIQCRTTQRRLDRAQHRLARAQHQHHLTQAALRASRQLVHELTDQLATQQHEIWRAHNNHPYRYSRPARPAPWPQTRDEVAAAIANIERIVNGEQP